MRNRYIDLQEQLKLRQLQEQALQANKQKYKNVAGFANTASKYMKNADNTLNFGDKVSGFGKNVSNFGDKINGFANKLNPQDGTLASKATQGFNNLGNNLRNIGNKTSDIGQTIQGNLSKLPLVDRATVGLSKAMPVAGTLAGGLSSASQFANGDYIGGGLNAASTLASTGSAIANGLAGAGAGSAAAGTGAAGAAAGGTAAATGGLAGAGAALGLAAAPLAIGGFIASIIAQKKKENEMKAIKLAQGSEARSTQKNVQANDALQQSIAQTAEIQNQQNDLRNQELQAQRQNNITNGTITGGASPVTNIGDNMSQNVPTQPDFIQQLQDKLIAQKMSSAQLGYNPNDLAQNIPTTTDNLVPASQLGNGADFFNNASQQVSNMQAQPMGAQYINQTPEALGAALGVGNVTDQAQAQEQAQPRQSVIDRLTSNIKDFATGMNDNYNTSFAEGDLANGTVGQTSVAGRLGELAGTAGRVMQNPLVQGLTAAALTRATAPQLGAYGALNNGLKTMTTAGNSVANREMLRAAGYDINNLPLGAYVSNDVAKNMIADDKNWKNFVAKQMGYKVSRENNIDNNKTKLQTTGMKIGSNEKIAKEKNQNNLQVAKVKGQYAKEVAGINGATRLGVANISAAAKRYSTEVYKDIQGERNEILRNEKIHKALNDGSIAQMKDKNGGAPVIVELGEIDNYLDHGYELIDF